MPEIEFDRWELHYMRRWQLKFLLLGLGAFAFVYAMMLLLSLAGLGHPNAATLLLVACPGWGMVGANMMALAFRDGVKRGRQHPSSASEE